VKITLTIDLEDPTLRYAPDGRYIPMTKHILDLCDETGNRKATFFTVGRVAQVAPQLIRDIAERGHEIAYHSHDHVSLTQEEPQRFRRECAEDKDRLEQLAGKSVIGFRAPRFSLTPQTLWALDVLKELGFRYSSSVMPTEVSLFGFPGAPSQSRLRGALEEGVPQSSRDEKINTPFMWPNGMIEFPLPVAPIGKYRLPYLGGIYLYTMPFFAVRAFLAKARAEEVLWTYAHPYDFDNGEKFLRMAKTPFWISFVLWRARRGAAKKIRKVLELGSAPPLCERLP
jgi:polysaccharide deacetylase family protein (PEP-CTERM system associated)